MRSSRLVTLLACTAVAAAVTTVASAPASSDTDHAANPYVAVRTLIPATARHFQLTSPDVRNGGAMPAASYASADVGFGCDGQNQPPRLRWHGAPSNAKSFAVTVQDLDAPTGSGFWHWVAWNIPAGATELNGPAGTLAAPNDAGVAGYTGPCPPQGDIRHRYQITLYALNAATLPGEPTAAIATFVLGGHVIAYGRITATAQR